MKSTGKNGINDKYDNHSHEWYKLKYGQSVEIRINMTYRQIYNIRRTSVDKKLDAHSYVGAAPTTSSFST